MSDLFTFHYIWKFLWSKKLLPNNNYTPTLVAVIYVDVCTTLAVIQWLAWKLFCYETRVSPTHYFILLTAILMTQLLYCLTKNISPSYEICFYKILQQFQISIFSRLLKQVTTTLDAWSDTRRSPTPSTLSRKPFPSEFSSSSLNPDQMLFHRYQFKRFIWLQIS